MKIKIKNYGKYMPVRLTRDDYRKVVQEEMVNSQVAIAVFDIIDFEGGQGVCRTCHLEGSFE